MDDTVPRGGINDLRFFVGGFGLSGGRFIVMRYHVLVVS